MNGNVIVGQSGGPTSVINSSLVGVFQGAKRAGCGKIYGMRNGLEGLLQERYVELNDCIKNDLDIEILKRTPSSFLGTCRYKLPHYEKDSAVYEKLFAILKKLDIKHFFYIGGMSDTDSKDESEKNDSGTGSEDVAEKDSDTGNNSGDLENFLNAFFNPAGKYLSFKGFQSRRHISHRAVRLFRSCVIHTV